MKVRRIAAICGGTVLTAGLVWSGYQYLGKKQPTTNLPTAPARQGEFLVMVRCRGELRARRSVQISAPSKVPELRIIWQAPAGEPVTENQVIIKFDPSSARQQLNEKKAALAQAQATLEQAVAQARIVAEQDKLELNSARYQVERAKLEASKAEIESKLKGEESRIDLALAEQKLRVQEATVQLHSSSDRAKVASLTRARDQAKAEVEVTEYRLSQMEVKAPMSGIVVYLPNYSQGWMNAKPFKVGDQVWPGAIIAELPDLSTLEMEAKLDEMDRSRIAAGNEVRIRVDALPEITFPGKLESVSALTHQGFEFPPTRTFRGFAPLQKGDQRLRPGMNSGMDIITSRIPNAITVPSKAVFSLKGHPVVYVLEAGGFHPKQVEILARNPDEYAVKGIAGGARVSLVEPPRKGPQI